MAKNTEEPKKAKLKRSIAKKDKKAVKEKKTRTENKKAGPQVPKPSKKEKKDHYLPGQKYDTPEESNGLRIYYSTWYEQEPGVKTAQKYLLEHGLLPKELAKKLAC